MSCPYCLSFTPPAAVPRPVRSGLIGPGAALQQRQIEQSRTLVKAYWEFEEGENRWLGFSPKVSVLLEAAYQNWLQNPSEIQSKINAGGFLYNVDYTTLLEEGQRQSQRIRRVGVTADQSSANGGNANGFCTVDPVLWSDMQKQLQDLKEEQEWLLRLLRGRSSNTEDFDTLDLKAKGAYGPLAEEVARLWRQLKDAEAAVRASKQAAEEAEALLVRLRDSVLPGRLLAFASGLAVARAVEDGEVLVLPGGEALPEFVAMRDVQASNAGLLARPGSKVWYLDGGIPKAGVVCGPPLDPRSRNNSEGPGLQRSESSGVQMHSVDVLRADGRCFPVPIASLQSRLSADPGLSVGDLVRAQPSQEADCTSRPLGTVLQVEDSSGRASSVCVRFPDEAGGFQDVMFAASKLSELELDKESDLIRPGVAVRLRMPRAGLKGATGVVFALHGNATAVVDFLGSWGHRCAASELEVVEDPPRVEVEIIKTLSECLTWTELLAAEKS
ncbi:unnamed protein product [Symbiodinium necroappetens]|uniref:WWE domain-containing protein n=1 Tax=Symbiodinium necroappetens TaxID=1628268 RepID=A0A812Q5J7_9DINO|nr:unnamed protein product [Symbiodinium necroappetens]